MPVKHQSLQSHDPIGFLSGNGEMATLTRQFDWASSSIGVIENWPQSLKTTLGIILHSKFPMFIFWGQDLVCFYNDAYRPSLGNGGKHPHALGKSGKENFPEIWPIIKPLLDQVLNGGDATWSENQLLPFYRNGQIEDIYWTFSYSPIIDENGEIAGVLTVCTETTDAVKNFQAMSENQDQLEFAIEATELGTWDLDPITNKFKGNERLKEWFGLPPKEEIQLTDAVNVILEKDRENVATAIGKALQYESGGFYDIEYTIVHPKTKEERVVRAKGRAWFNDEKIAIRFNGTLQDISEQAIFTQALKEKEHLLSNVIKESPVRISLLTGPEMKITLANEIVLDSWGKGDSVIGLPLKEAIPEMQDQNFLEILDRVYTSGLPFSSSESKVQILNKNGLTDYHFDIWYKPIFDINNDVYGVLTSATDVTEKVLARQKIANSESRFRELIESAPFPIAVYVGKDLIVEIANQSMLETWGKGNNVIGKSYTKILPEIESTEIFDQAYAVLNTGIPFHSKNAKVDLIVDGKMKSSYFNYSFTPLLDANGNIYGVMNTGADVTDLNVTNLKLEESEQRFKSLVAAAPIGIGVFLGKDFIIGTHNQAFIDILGKGDDILGKKLQDVLPELTTENQPFLQILSDVFSTGKTFQTFGTQVKLERHGIMTSNYYDVNFTPLHDLNGEVYGILDTAFDVTENVLAKQKIEENEKNLRNTILQAPVAMCILKGANHFVYIANEKMLRLWGKTHDEVVGKILIEGLNEIVGQGFDLLLDHVFSTGETYRAYDVPLKFSEDTVFVDFVYEAFREPDNSISGVMVIATDVTEQFLARLKIEAAEESARLAIESADLGSYVVDLETQHIQTSDRFNEIWGLEHSMSRDEITKHVHPFDRQIREKAHRDSLLTGNLDYETRVVWPDESVHWVKIKGKVLFKEDETPITLIGVIQDITEQKRFSDELSKQVHERTMELNRSNEDLLHFAHIASHDLKEPVRKIKVFTNMIEDQFGELLPEKGQIYLHKVQNATDRMFAMIEGILTYSAINASDQPIEKISLNEIIESIETDLEVLIHSKEASINSDSLPEIEGGSVLIYQLFYNLINNALKFTKPDVKPIITIHSSIINREEVNFAEISLADNGIGIEQEYASQIFNAFTRLNAKDKFEGTGLGLALCKKIVERHNGSITATGIKNEGAVFTILLPLKQSKEEV